MSHGGLSTEMQDEVMGINGIGSSNQDMGKAGLSLVPLLVPPF